MPVPSKPFSEVELSQLRFSPARKKHIIAVTRRRRVSWRERVQDILDYEIALTLPQLGAGLAFLTVAFGP